MSRVTGKEKKLIPGSRLSPLLNSQSQRSRRRCEHNSASPSPSNVRRNPSTTHNNNNNNNNNNKSGNMSPRNKKRDGNPNAQSKVPLVPSTTTTITSNNSNTKDKGNILGNTDLNLEGSLPTPVFSAPSYASLSRFGPISNVNIGYKVEEMEKKETTSSDRYNNKDNDSVNSSSILFGDILTDDLLKEWTGFEDLHLILTAEFRVDAIRTTGIDTLSDKMPLLNSLKLNNSRVPQIRLLGTKFMNLKRLWLGSSHLETLRGIGACTPVLEELYISFNSIYDIAPLLDLSESLEVLDLEGNEIQDLSSLTRCLPLMKKLKYLTLQGNPVVMSQTNLLKCNIKNEEIIFTSFRELISSIMPKLLYLDDISIILTNSNSNMCEKSKNEKSSKQKKKLSFKSDSTTFTDPLNISLREEYMFMQQCIRECGFDALDEVIVEETKNIYSRPQTSCPGARRCNSASFISQNSHRPFSSSHTLQNTTSLRLGNNNNNNNNNSDNNNTTTGVSVSCPVFSRPTGMNSNNGNKTSVLHSPFASTLTLGRTAMVGGAIGLRRKLLPPLHPSSAGSNNSSYNNNNNNNNNTNSRCGSSRCVSAQQQDQYANQQEDNSCTGTSLKMNTSSIPEREINSPAILRLEVEDEIDNSPLFDDDEEDEWEIYKQSLLRRVDSKDISVAQRWGKYVTSESNIFSSPGDQESGGLSSFSHTTSTRTTSASSNPTISVIQLNNINNNNINNNKVQPLTPISDETLPLPPPPPPPLPPPPLDPTEISTTLENNNNNKQREYHSEENKGTENIVLNSNVFLLSTEDHILRGEEEKAWREELVRSVARTRTQTARIAIASERLGGV